jgi:hypothetical protein
VNGREWKERQIVVSLDADKRHAVQVATNVLRPERRGKG